ncbi:MAG: hypothetical protein Q9159_007336 [Coniocarpon cinnabarinum]
MSASTRWYRNWLLHQLDQCPSSLFAILPTSSKEVPSNTISSCFISVWTAIAQMLRDQIVDTVDHLVEALCQRELLCMANESLDELDVARNLVFTIIGWQSMLFKADYGSAPPRHVCLADEMNGFRSESRLVLQQHAN